MKLSSFTAYVKQLWKNKPDTSTPLSAERLTHMEEGIKGNSDAIEAIAAAVVSQIANDPDKIASMAALYSVNQKIGDVSKLPDSAADVVTAIAKQNSNLGSTYGYISDLDVPDVILGVYDVNSANSPYKKGLTQATAGIVLSVYNTNSVYNSQLALSAGNEKIYIRQKGNNTWGEWMAK